MVHPFVLIIQSNNLSECYQNRSVFTAKKRNGIPE